MAKETRIGSGPVEAEIKETLNKLGQLIDVAINRSVTSGKKRWGFILMMFPFENFRGRCNYLSNADRDTVKTLLREQLAYFEGAPDNQQGTA